MHFNHEYWIKTCKWQSFLFFMSSHSYKWSKIDSLILLHRSSFVSKFLSQQHPKNTGIDMCCYYACRGCITSAETVILQKQSLDEFLSSIDEGKTVIVSLSPQSRSKLSCSLLWSFSYSGELNCILLVLIFLFTSTRLPPLETNKVPYMP